MHRDDADVVILSLGIDRDVEHEDKDRHNTTLSDPQEQLALAVLAKAMDLLQCVELYEIVRNAHDECALSGRS